MHYFQQPGVADAELDTNVDEFLRRVFWALTDTDRYLTCWEHPTADNGYLDVLPTAPPLPWEWLTTDEFQYYVDEFTRTGFTGGLNWYRAADLVWEQNAELHDKPVLAPTVFIPTEGDAANNILSKA